VKDVSLRPARQALCFHRRDECGDGIRAKLNRGERVAPSKLTFDEVIS
jgi:hypothetical protein